MISVEIGCRNGTAEYRSPFGDKNGPSAELLPFTAKATPLSGVAF
jgi:hypothetical protein